MDLNKIYNMDCLEGLKSLEDKSIDLVLTSPPYDNLRTYEGIGDEWNFTAFTMIAEQLFRVLKDNGVIVWVVGDATIDGCETGTSFKQALHFVSLGLNLHDTMIYYKDNPCPIGGSNRYYQSFEYMFVLSKGAPKTFNALTEPRRNKWNDTRTERVRYVQRNADGSTVKKSVKINTEDPKRRNVWCYTMGQSDHTGHPAVFPYKLALDHICSWSNKGDVVLDPFMGSGTTAMACAQMGRKFIGFEKNVNYYKAANERLRKFTGPFRIYGNIGIE